VIFDTAQLLQRSASAGNLPAAAPSPTILVMIPNSGFHSRSMSALFSPIKIMEWSGVSTDIRIF
jgi:hypothetical protein